MQPETDHLFFSTYCERTLPGVWEEPLNALTNLAFIVSGILVLRFYRKHGEFTAAKHWDFLLLIFLLFAIGVGSALWHFVPTRFTVLADVIPILLFINIYLLSFFHRVFEIQWRGLIIVFFVFQLLNFGVAVVFPGNFLNGSIFYAPGWLTLISIGVYLFATKHQLHGRLLAAGGIFTMALVFRTIDRDICQWVPIGTHFIWHILNAWLLYLLSSALLKQEAKRRLLMT